MTAPHDIRLERLSDRMGRRSDHLGEVVRLASPVADHSSEGESQATREALNNAVFTAAGVTEWLSGLRRAVAAMLSSSDAAKRIPVAPDAIHAADARSSAV
jgi:hypothetical protein